MGIGYNHFKVLTFAQLLHRSCWGAKFIKGTRIMTHEGWLQQRSETINALIDAMGAAIKAQDVELVAIINNRLDNYIKQMKASAEYAALQKQAHAEGRIIDEVGKS